MKKKRLNSLDYILITLLLTGVGLFLYRLIFVFEYNWQWARLVDYIVFFDADSNSWRLGSLLLGFITTIKLAFWSVFFALLIGVPMGVLGARRNLFSRALSGCYVAAIRNLPALILVFIFYYFIGDHLFAAVGLDRWARTLSPAGKNVISFFFYRPALFSRFVSAALVLGIYEGSYVAEIVRAGISSIDSGQWQAGHALGFSRFQQYRLIILPQALKNTLPALANQGISAIKDSAIVSIISIPELTFQGIQIIGSINAGFEVWLLITAFYFLLTFSCSMFLNRLFNRLHKAHG